MDDKATLFTGGDVSHGRCLNYILPFHPDFVQYVVPRTPEPQGNHFGGSDILSLHSSLAIIQPRDRGTAIIDIDGLLRDTTINNIHLPDSHDVMVTAGNPNASYDGFNNRCGKAKPMLNNISYVKDVIRQNNLRPIFLTSCTASHKSVLATMNFLKQVGLLYWSGFDTPTDEPVVAFRARNNQLEPSRFKKALLELAGYRMIAPKSVHLFEDDEVLCKAIAKWGATIHYTETNKQNLREVTYSE